MNKKITLLFALASLSIILFGALIAPSQRKITMSDSDYTTKTVTIGTATVTAMVVDTDAKRTLGLGKRSSLGPNDGMLFVFPSAVTTAFWMKDMAFPIDIIWLKDSKVVHISASVQPPQAGTPDSSLPLYSPGQLIDSVLEVNAGFASAHSIKVGDSITVN